MEERYGFHEVEPGRRLEKEFQGASLCFIRLFSAPEIKPWLDLLNELWGFSAEDRLPLHEAVVAVKTGGLFLGAEWNGSPAGLVYVLPAFSRERGGHHHSNFMGFVPEHRSRGLGLEAKRAHAILARREGVNLVTWTFDPLQAANANLNFRKLGALCRTYLPDLYGSMGGNFDPGLPSDRFLVEWRLDTERVESRLQGAIPPPGDLARKFADAPVIGEDLNPEQAAAAHGPLLLEIPGAALELARSEPEVARRLLADFRDRVAGLFAAGFAVTEMLPAAGQETADYYVLEKGVC